MKKLQTLFTVAFAAVSTSAFAADPDLTGFTGMDTAWIIAAIVAIGVLMAKIKLVKGAIRYALGMFGRG